MNIVSVIKNSLQSLRSSLPRHRQALVYIPIYFFISLTDLVLKLRLTNDWQNGKLVENHSLLMAFQYYNNEQSRLMQFLVPEVFHRLFNISIIASYTISRFLFVFLAFVAFHYFLRKWFTEIEAFAGVMILSASLMVGFLIGDLQESAPLLMLLFVLGLWAIREENDLLFCVLLLLGGGLTNETMLVMPLGYFRYNVKSWKLPGVLRTGLRTVALALPAFLAQGTMRYITRFQPHLVGAIHWTDNIQGIWHELTDPYNAILQGIYIYPFLAFSIFWFLAFLGLSKSPRFLKSVFWIVPFFIAAHMITGVIREARQMVPLGYILIPMALFFMIPEARNRLPAEEI